MTRFDRFTERLLLGAITMAVIYYVGRFLVWHFFHI
jgi:hypothetical protein